MIMSEFRSLPETPNSQTPPGRVRRSNTMAELHSGQKVTATGTPATLSFTISCQVR